MYGTAMAFIGHGVRTTGVLLTDGSDPVGEIEVEVMIGNGAE